jgi:predicted kinase
MGGAMILLAGYLAAGKSTFSRRLSERLSIPCLNKDAVKEVLSEVIGFADREENKKLSNAAMETMLHMAGRLVECGVPVIVESNFHTGEGERFAALARANHTRILTLLFLGDLREMYSRFVTRLKSPDRHRTHKTVDISDFDSFRAYCDELAGFNTGDEIIKVDATSFQAVDYEGLIRGVKDFIQRGI